MLWTILWWAGGVAGGVVALWLLAAAAGLDRPRRMLRGARHRTSPLACGACGHEAVEPDRITSCPECGAQYALAGLLTTRAALRLGPPLWVVGVLLLGLVVIGGALLAPRMARIANRQSIGTPHVEQARITHSYLPAAGFALNIHRELLRAQPPGAWTQNPPVLEGSVRVELLVGSSVAGGINNPANLGMPRYHLELPFIADGGDRWTLVDVTQSPATILAEGDGGAAQGMARLFDAANLGPTSPSAAVTGAELAAMGELAGAFQAAGGGGLSGNVGGLVAPTGLTARGVGTSMLGSHVFHRAAPWGIAAGVLTGVGLAVVAGVVLTAIIRARRGLRSAVGAGRDGGTRETT